MRKLFLAVAIFFVAISAQAQTPYKLSQKEWAVIDALLLGEVFDYLETGETIIVDVNSGAFIESITRIRNEIEDVNGVGGDISGESLVVAALGIAIARVADSEKCGVDDYVCLLEIRELPRQMEAAKEVIGMLFSSGWGVGSTSCEPQ